MFSFSSPGEGDEDAETPEQLKKKARTWLGVSLIAQVIIVGGTLGLLIYFEFFDLPDYAQYLVYANVALNVIVCIVFAYYGLKKEEKWALYMFAIFILFQLIAMIGFWIWVIVVAYSKPPPPKKRRRQPDPDATTTTTSRPIFKRKKKKKKSDDDDPRAKVMSIAVTNMIVKTIWYLCMLVLTYRVGYNVVYTGNPAQ